MISPIDDTPIIHCPLPECGEVMIYDRRQKFWQCPRCGTEVWKDGAKLAALEEEKVEKAIEAYRRRQAEKERAILLWSSGLPPAKPRSLSFAGTIKHGGKKSGKRWKHQRKRAARRRYADVEVKKAKRRDRDDPLIPPSKP